MSRALVILIISFAAGAGLGLVVRAGFHRPYAMPDAAASVVPPMTMTGHHDEHGDMAHAPMSGDQSQHHADGPLAGSGTTTGAPARAVPAAASGTPSSPALHAPAAQLPGPAVEPGPLESSGVLAVKPGRDTINTICPVCGFEVEPSLPTSTYHGKVIGFGCRANRCKEKFDADPDRFGPAGLANRKAE